MPPGYPKYPLGVCDDGDSLEANDRRALVRGADLHPAASHLGQPQGMPDTTGQERRHRRRLDQEGKSEHGQGASRAVRSAVSGRSEPRWVTTARSSTITSGLLVAMRPLAGLVPSAISVRDLDEHTTAHVGEL